MRVRNLIRQREVLRESFQKNFLFEENKPEASIQFKLLRLIRMKRASQLLRSGNLNVTQVMYQVGLKNPSYFARSFRQYFGMNPSDYQSNN